jgi:type I restriction enzyme R subunit
VLKPEALARETIDEALQLAGWILQDVKTTNVHAGPGVAVREFPLGSHGFADYLLYVKGKAAGVIEAKSLGTPLTGVESQTGKYSQGLPPRLPAWLRPLPFLYQSTGEETRFTNLLDPEPRSRHVFHFHRPETLAEWLQADPLLLPLKHGKPDPRSEWPATLRGRLQQLPALNADGLWPAQVKAIQNLETSLAQDRPRALIQMATGSGKTFTAVNSIYRLIKYGHARRVLFLVDRANLGDQALKEFQQFDVPEGNQKFSQEFNVQLLKSNNLDGVARVCITTIQRLYSMIQGEPELAPEAEEASLFDASLPSNVQLPVRYNPALPIETFDVIFTDECHRSIYNLWRQVLEYFDAYLVGLTATPSKQTLGFFNQNLVMEYGHAQAVADKVNVDFDVYRIRTEITEQGSRVESGLYVDRRDRLTRARRWEQLDDDLVYAAQTLDRDVVAEDQIRTVLRTFRDKLFTELFPDRQEVPKTVIFAKDDSHADDIVRIAREEFGKGNDYIQKITYRTTGKKPKDLINEFRTTFFPRIAVTVDMIATGTDIKAVEIVMFMRAVRSRLLFEQMKGRGVRVISVSDLRTVTSDAKGKDRFVVVDCVGICESGLVETQSLERLPQSTTLNSLMDSVGFGSTDPDVVSTLAGRLARLSRKLGAPELERIREVAGADLMDLVRGMVEALDPDRQIEAARKAEGLPEGAEPSPAQVKKAAEHMLKEAVAPLARNPALRQEILTLKQRAEQTIDVLSKDRVLEAGYSPEAKEKAKAVVESFEKFLEENKDQITALQVMYSKPWAKRLTYKNIKSLAQAIEATPRAWTSEGLWRAYETLHGSKVKGASVQRLLTDIVSLVRYALHQEDELVPFPERVEARFENWVAQQENRGRKFTAEQREWLVLIKDQVATSFKVERDDFEDVPFNQKGGLGKVARVFGAELDGLLDELNEVLVA